MSKSTPARLAPLSAFDRAIKAAGGAGALAKSIGVGPSAVSNWKLAGVPASRCPAIEALTGVPMRELRPDLWPHSARTA